MGAPANLTLITLTGWFIGQGLTRVALYLSVGINILNIVCNYLLAIELQLNSYGIALGTVISEYAGAVIASCVLWKNLLSAGLSFVRFRHLAFGYSSSKSIPP